MVEPAAFFEPLRIDTGSQAPVAEPSTASAEAARLIFLQVPVGNQPLPRKTIAAETAAGLACLIEWLRSRDPSEFEEVRNRGLRVDLYMDIGIDYNELDIELPHLLLLECGRRKLGIVSNAHDFSIDRE